MDAKKQLIQPKGPTPWPIVGNTFDALTLEQMRQLIKKYGKMVPLTIPGMKVFLCSDVEVIRDMLKKKDDFQKTIPPPHVDLGNIRKYTTGDALFTSADSEEIWQIAHRILLPGFGIQAIRQYYDRMLSVADALLERFDTFNPDDSILITDWMTKMTFDAIGYACFSTRFHGIQNEYSPPFVKAMYVTLNDALKATGRLFPHKFYFFSNRRRKKADDLMRQTVQQIIDERKRMLVRGESVPNDLLQIMLTTKDKITGKKLSEDNIGRQLITFLIAGHETTSGLLSYAIYHLMKNPQAEKKLMDEVDLVLGRDYSYHPSYADLEKLSYTLRVLKETLRLNPTAPGFFKTAMKDTIVADKYEVKKDDMVFVLLSSLHQDSEYWGPDAQTFEPDRFLPDEVKKRDPDVYHPFGGGIRSCIGFQFALTEATMVLARLYQRFRFLFADPDYCLEDIESITIKPKNLVVKIEKRKEEKGRFPEKREQPLERAQVVTEAPDAPPILFLFGSNMGTCQEIAQNLAKQAKSRGYHPIIKELNDQVEKPWDSQYVMIVTSTYNGTPPDNAIRFESWMKKITGQPFSFLNYTVLGVGNKQWHATFQFFPIFLNQKMQELGAFCFYPLGAADVDGDYDKTIESWSKGAWEAIQKKVPTSIKDVKQVFRLNYQTEVINFAGAQSQKIPSIPIENEAKKMIITKNVELLSPAAKRSTRHIEIALPPNSDYRSGDHLGVLPENPPEAVQRAADLFRLRLDDMVVIKSLQDLQEGEKLPIGTPISVRDLLTSYVDLLGTVSRKEVRLLAEICPCPPEKKALEALAEGEKFSEEVLKEEKTFLDICEQFRSIPTSLDLLLTARPILKPRYYSISSSPCVLSDSCAITVGVQEHETLNHHLFKGICSHYLASKSNQSSILCFVKDTKSFFRLPDNPKQDIILIGPGTGLAPLRGFLQERNFQRSQNIPIGRQVLFFGCRHPDQDFIYREELEGYLHSGLLQGLFVGFSRIPGIPKQYVQDLLKKKSSLVWEYVKADARIMVCGEGKNMAPAVREALKDIFQKEGKLSKEEAEQLFQKNQQEHLYVEDVWAAT